MSDTNLNRTQILQLINNLPDPVLAMIAKELADKNEDHRRASERQALAIRSDRLRALGEMAAGLAHELNQPLSGIRGYAENLLISFRNNWSVTEAEIIHKMERIIQQTERMSTLINHIHDFSRDAEVPVLMPVSVRQVIDSALSLTGVRIRSHGIELELSLGPEGTYIQANPFSLEEVLLAIISNAFDAVEEVEKLETRFIKVSSFSRALSESSVVVIEVRDNGCGISEENLCRVFDPFFTTKDPNRGVGLGLTVAKSIVTSLGGEIEISSEPSSGTTVRLVFPEFHPA